MGNTGLIGQQAARAMRLLSGPVERAIRDGADPELLAETLAASIPSSFDVYGPFYDTAGVTRWLGITRQAVEKRAARHKLLAVKTSDRHLLYPVWQFDASARTVPDALQAVLGVLLPAAQTSWTVAAWLRTPTDDDGQDAITMIRLGGGNEVLTQARRDAARWVQ